MRLIDADEFYERMLADTDIGAEMEVDGLKALKKYIDLQPTAYDVDKVVENIDKKYNNSSWIKGNEEFSITRNEFIEIVKQGGVETETETIRDKAVKWNNNSSKRVPYEFIDYLEGKREIGASDDVCKWESDYGFVSDKYKRETSCGYTFYDLHHAVAFKFCPYCGKKIKVVD